MLKRFLQFEWEKKADEVEYELADGMGNLKFNNSERFHFLVYTTIPFLSNGSSIPMVTLGT